VSSQPADIRAKKERKKMQLLEKIKQNKNYNG
jgi:hypothetical protein